MYIYIYPCNSVLVLVPPDASANRLLVYSSFPVRPATPSPFQVRVRFRRAIKIVSQCLHLRLTGSRPKNQVAKSPRLFPLPRLGSKGSENLGCSIPCNYQLANQINIFEETVFDGVVHLSSCCLRGCMFQTSLICGVLSLANKDRDAHRFPLT